MATIWLTYAWADNEERDVDFLAQELEAAGADMKLDRWNIKAGRRLWEQIEHFITDPTQSDAWALVATDDSLRSESCQEEFAYALDRALNTRGGEFPVVGLFLGPVDETLIPAGIRTRLFVSLTDPDWKERIIASAEGRDPAVRRVPVEPCFVKVHEIPGQEMPMAIEVRPRAGVWAPFIAGVPLDERDEVDPSIMCGPRGIPTDSGVLFLIGEGEDETGDWWLMSAANKATPTQSYYVWCRERPSKLLFGAQPQPLYMEDFSDK